MIALNTRAKGKCPNLVKYRAFADTIELYVNRRKDLEEELTEANYTLRLCLESERQSELQSKLQYVEAELKEVYKNLGLDFNSRN